MSSTLFCKQNETGALEQRWKVKIVAKLHHMNPNICLPFSWYHDMKLIFTENMTAFGTPSRFVIRELKQLWRRRQLQKTIGLNDQNNSSARASCFLAHFFDIYYTTTTWDLLRRRISLPLFLTWIKSLRIQLQEKLPAIDILSGSKYIRLSLKESKFIFLATFSLPLSSSLCLRSLW